MTFNLTLPMFPLKGFTLDIHHSDLTETAKKCQTFALEKHTVILKNLRHSLWDVPTTHSLSPGFCLDCVLSLYLSIKILLFRAPFQTLC